MNMGYDDNRFELDDVERNFIERALSLGLIDNRSRRLMCVECGTTSPYERGWRVFLSEDDPPRTAVFCPECAEVEFATRA